MDLLQHMEKNSKMDVQFISVSVNSCLLLSSPCLSLPFTQGILFQRLRWFCNSSQQEIGDLTFSHHGTNSPCSADDGELKEGRWLFFVQWNLPNASVGLRDSAFQKQSSQLP